MGNIECRRILGADVRLDAAGFDIGIRPSWEQAMSDVQAAGGKPYPIPAGCSEHPLGGLGFVGFAEEVRAQEKPSWASSSITSSSARSPAVRKPAWSWDFAGTGARDRVIGIDASAKPHSHQGTDPATSRANRRLVELGREITEGDVVLDAGYGGPELRPAQSEGPLAAIRLCARLEGMLTDPVYEGKSMHGMIDIVNKGQFPEGSKVLYAHLGGVPAINGYAYAFRNG